MQTGNFPAISYIESSRMDDLAGREAGRLRAIREAAGLSPQPSDILIAGITNSLGASLATRSTSDFAALPLQVINPWSA